MISSTPKAVNRPPFAPSRTVETVQKTTGIWRPVSLCPISPLYQSEVKNRLLKALPATVFMVLSRHMERRDLPPKEVLVEANQPTSHVCFIESGLGSVVADSSDGETVEVGHVGREGMSGYHVLLMETSTHKTFMQVAGTGGKVPVRALRAVCDEHPSVRNMLLRYVHSCEVQLAHSALANARYSMHERWPAGC